MAESKNTGDVETRTVGGLLQSLADKHSQLDIRLQHVNVALPRAGVSIELNGLVSVSVHMRDLTEDEKKALAAKNVSMMSQP
jgi:hypothetical protein